MKKFLSLILVLTSLLMVTGCGKKATTPVDDSESLYPSNYAEEKDYRLTINIEGEWDEDCHWCAEYDEEMLTCEAGKDGKSFTFGSTGFDTTEINLRLYRGEAENWEYTLWYFLQCDGLGGARILAATHIEPKTEGTYTYEQDEEGNLLFCINTTHQWGCRTLSDDVEVEKAGRGEGDCTFVVKTGSEEQGSVQLFDEEGALMLTLTVCKEAGATRLENVESSDDTAFGQKNLDFFWQQIGFTLPIPDGIVVEEATVSTDDDFLFPCGDMELTINGQAFDYALSLDESWMEEYRPDMTGEPDVGQEPLPSTEEQITIDTVDVTVFTQGERSMAVWEEYGAHFGIEGECDKSALMEALHVLLEG